jgi:hypothetical protein
MNNTAAEFSASLYRNASKLSGPEWSAYLASEANAHRFSSREFGEVLYLVSRSGFSLVSGRGVWRLEPR